MLQIQVCLSGAVDVAGIDQILVGPVFADFHLTQETGKTSSTVC